MATTPLAAATPSPPPHIHTPPTPRLGFADSWEPFSPRKSSRIAAASKNASRPSAAARTPSPSAATRRAVRQLRSPKVSKQAAAPPQNDTLQPHPQHLDVASFSPAPTPRKKKTLPTAHFLSPEDALKSNRKPAEAQAAAGEYSRMGVGMLPTPAKTPSKKYHAASQNESNIAAIARNLFHHNDVDEVMASPSKKPSTPSRKPKKYTGFSLESFAEVEDEIPIFTDSQDRVPEADSSVENPFFGDGAAAGSSAPEATTRRRSKRNHVSIPGEGKQTVEDATRREDGLVYVFRGKKIFRKFEDSAEAQEEDILDGMSSSGGKSKRLTRSAIKPRLLFPREDSLTETTPNAGTTDDEEADTDIEDRKIQSDDEVEEEVEEDEEVTATSTPVDLLDKAAPNTPPHAPKFAPASPPITGRATRSGHKSAEEATPVKAAAPKKRSPFDGWRQTKSSASVAGHKRPVDTALGSSPSAKRSRT
ncbi:hypothetical protein SEUCBS139899_007232 [Sporothrix eucalyptigena]|uniref:Uncharacterized protein n=1 Tax=Sporothrix eucalyptigena TaxID=1812306 RepID=A0ABP0B730_9PEZI